MDMVQGDALSSRHLGHRRIRHKERIYVGGNVHTQTIEGFVGLVKTSIRGTYHAVSAKWLQGYLNAFALRYNRRDEERPMFESLLPSRVLNRPPKPHPAFRSSGAGPSAGGDLPEVAQHVLAPRAGIW